MKRKKLRPTVIPQIDYVARDGLRPHPYVNEIWATLECRHPCFFRFFVTGKNTAMLRCCECEYVYYPANLRVDAVCYAIGAAL